VVSDTDVGDKELSKDAAIAHEKVLEEVMKYSPIVPVAFGHVAKSEDELKTKLLEAQRDKIEELLTYLDGKIELLLDGGETEVGVESTVVDTTVPPYKILREGAIKEGQIADSL